MDRHVEHQNLVCREASRERPPKRLKFVPEPAAHDPKVNERLHCAQVREQLLQLRVFGLGLFQDGDVWVDVFFRG